MLSKEQIQFLSPPRHISTISFCSEGYLENTRPHINRCGSKKTSATFFLPQMLISPAAFFRLKKPTDLQYIAKIETIKFVTTYIIYNMNNQNVLAIFNLSVFLSSSIYISFIEGRTT